MILGVSKIKLDFQNINWENRSLGHKLQDFKLTEKCFYNEIPLNLQVHKFYCTVQLEANFNYISEGLNNKN